MNKKKFLTPLPIIITVAVLVVGGVGFVGALNGWFGGGGSIPEDTMTRGLVGYWGFDEGSGTVAHDASNYANNGAASSTWATGKVGGAANLDGVDDYTSVADSDSLDLTSSLTFEAWIKVNSHKNYNLIIDKPNSTGAIYNYEFYLNSSGNLGFWSQNGVTSNDKSSTGTVTAGSWSHVVFTVNPSGDYAFYINGVQSGDGTLASTLASTDWPLQIGDNLASATGIHQNFFSGLIDEVRIYNRALSEAEARYHYNRGAPVAEWKMDEGSGRTVYDSTNNNNDGTLILAGSATSSAWVSGKYGTALSFDGTDDYVDCGNGASLSFGLGDFSIGTWIKTTKDYGTALREFIDKENGNKGYILGIKDNKVLAFIGDGTDYALVSSGSTINDGAWHYIALTFTHGVTGLKVFRDGVEVGSADTTRIDSTTAQAGVNLKINADKAFKGVVDDVRIYNYARTSDEIQLDYNAGFAAKFGSSGLGCKDDPASCMTEGLVGYWGFDEGSGTVAHDASNYANNGAASSTWATGKVGGAAGFDGVDDVVTLPSAPFSFTAESFTAELWFKSNNLATVPFLLSNTNEAENQGWELYLGPSGNVYLGTGSAGGAAYSSTAAGAVTTNAWYHISVTRSGTSARIYLNGVDRTSTAGVHVDPAPTTNLLRVGSWGYIPPNYSFSGLIDEVRIYNRALSAEEVRYHYNQSRPVAYWKMDEGEGRTVYDSTENNNDGALVLAGSATSSAWVSGKYGTALSFDGTDDYVNVVDNSSLDITSQISLEAWIKLNNTTVGDTANVNGILGKDDNGGDGYALEIESDQPRFIINSWSGKSLKSPSTISLGEWYHISGIYDGSKVYLYVNGVLVNSSLYSVSIGTNELPVKIGKSRDNTGIFNGLIDDVRIYNYARTPEEIRLDYNAGLAAHFGPQGSCDDDPGACITEGLVGYWGFDEGSGTVVHDASNYANNGTTTMTAPWTSGIVPFSGGKSGGGGLQFDGTDDYLVVGNADSLSVTGDLTIEAWIKKNTIAGIRELVAKSYAREYEFYAQNGYLYLGQGDGGTFEFIGPLNTGAMTAGRWYHVAVVRKMSDMKLYGYVNGIENKGGVAFTKTPVSGTSRVFMGDRGAAPYGPFSGILDEVRIYNRALSAEEIRYHYNSGGPVAEWKMDEGEGRTVYDSTPNNNDGTLILAGSATSSAWVSGKHGSALSFDGVDDYVNAGQGASLTITGALTLEAWIKADSFTCDSFFCQIIDKHYSEYHLRITNAINGQKIQFYVNSGGTIVLGKTSLSAGEWHHIVAVFKPSQFLKVYLDGVEDGAKTTGVPASTNSSAYSLLIGRRVDIDGAYFEGLIDDVRIYNYARTATQIQQDYNAGLSTYFK